MTLVRAEHTKADHRHAAYVRLVFADAQGCEWFFETASFWFELKPLQEASRGKL